ncbi:MAG TPA: YihY/virulence factor BrkB family protein [Streptosporangiaceae bacterium]|nr:YihY/virulence factor BrkB family protein [Streptosporangiaceae bacterium]
MNAVQSFLHMVDRSQQRWPWLAFPVAVWKKFGDDQAGDLAALIAYYGFASLFPLLLVLVTVLDIVLHSHPALRDTLVDSTFGKFPVVGTQLQNSTQQHALKSTGPALGIGLLLTFLGARGVANAAQNAFNTVWGVPISRRPGFPWNLLRSIALILGVGTGMLVTTVISGLVGNGTAGFLGGVPGRIGAVVVSLLLNIGLFWLGFRLATAREVNTRDLLPGAVLAAIGWQVLQLVGGILVGHTIAHSSSLYGVFGVVLGLLAWLYLQAQLTLYAMEVSVVWVKRLWPRSIAPPPLTPQDERAYEMYAQAQQRHPGQDISVQVSDTQQSEPDPAKSQDGPRGSASRS